MTKIIGKPKKFHGPMCHKTYKSESFWGEKPMTLHCAFQKGHKHDHDNHVCGSDATPFPNTKFWYEADLSHGHKTIKTIISIPKTLKDFVPLIHLECPLDLKNNAMKISSIHSKTFHYDGSVTWECWGCGLKLRTN